MEPSDTQKIYRLYIDESGTHDYSKSDEIKDRYLCLMGVIISFEDNKNFITPQWDEMRNLFTEDQDFPAVFHLSDVMRRAGVFGRLKNPGVQEKFNDAYLEILENGRFTICSVVLDKKQHLARYGSSAMHPYHYCLNVLLERYINFLLENNGSGDVVAEVRGKKEDNKLKSEFEHFYNNGTNYLTAETVQKRLTTKKLKLKTKEARIAGLELADMLATPMKFLTLYKYDRIPKLSENFTLNVLKAVNLKIRRAPWNPKRTKGFGTKLI